MEDINLLNEIVDELNQEEKEVQAEKQKFKERYELLADCITDELNDEILRLRLNDIETVGSFMLMQDGKHMVYRHAIVSAEMFTGGEEFVLRSVERGIDTGKTKSLINFLFEPVSAASYSHLVLSYDQAIKYMDDKFAKVVAVNLLDSMQETEKEILTLQREVEECDRQREICRTQDATASVYKAESSW